jgi:hypothetical protein
MTSLEGWQKHRRCLAIYRLSCVNVLHYMAVVRVDLPPFADFRGQERGPARFTEPLGQFGSEAWVALANLVQDKASTSASDGPTCGRLPRLFMHEPEVRTEHPLLRATHATTEARQVAQSLGDHVI